ncbi:hypothetical protein EYR41_004217 [Orbilia oligospora]|uniref:LysM domain-containing protein n=1 Tax=Orbilia oligospora TaxID=2813651 RepID=A0A8H2HS92_ORBOL|nr:hypothetical protein EYR41_004217 [Orbilia oligospora]
MMYRSSLGPMALVGLAELLNGCYAYVPSSPKHLRGRQNGVAGCPETFTAAKGDDCQFISSIYGISVENLIKWNPSLKSPADCDKLLQPGTTYCVSAPSTTTKTTTSIYKSFSQLRNQVCGRIITPPPQLESRRMLGSELSTVTK